MGVIWSVLLMFYLFGLQLVGKSKLGSLFLELGKLVFVFGHLLEGGLDELALHVTDGDGELVCGGIFKISFGSTTFSNDTETLLGFALLLLLQLLSCLLAEEGAELLL